MLELLMNIWDGRKLLHIKKFVSLRIPRFSPALFRTWLPRLQQVKYHRQQVEKNNFKRVSYRKNPGINSPGLDVQQNHVLWLVESSQTWPGSILLGHSNRCMASPGEFVTDFPCFFCGWLYSSTAVRGEFTFPPSSPSNHSYMVLLNILFLLLIISIHWSHNGSTNSRSRIKLAAGAMRVWWLCRELARLRFFFCPRCR